MLYDDSRQIDVRYIIFLAHYNVSIYSGGSEIPEEELWAKRNAIRLTRRPDSTSASQASSLPFYIFSENLSEKEDLYFAMLRNKEKMPESAGLSPAYVDYDARHIITLLQRLYSSEEQRPTRWINALLGRLFLALYRMPEIEESVMRKIAKKISRVKTPNFITKLAVRKVDMGEGAPFINSPKLRELTLDGDCVVEADLSYTGNFRLEISATVHIDLGTRFKSREVELALAVVLNRVDGRGLVRLKPPPSNRIWFSFETMPKVVMSIEPIFGSRQITYGVVLRAIESRIREIISETIVLPFWEDIPFLDTSAHLFRGGIWRSKNPKSDKNSDVNAKMEVDTDEPCVGCENISTNSLEMEAGLETNTSGLAHSLGSSSSSQNNLVSMPLEPQNITTGIVDAEIGAPGAPQRKNCANQMNEEMPITQEIPPSNTFASPQTFCPQAQSETSNNNDIPRATSVVDAGKGGKHSLSAQSLVSIRHRPSFSAAETETSFAKPAVGELSRRRNTSEFFPEDSASSALRGKYESMKFLRSATGMSRSWSWSMSGTKENVGKATISNNINAQNGHRQLHTFEESLPDHERTKLECGLLSPQKGPAPVSLASAEENSAGKKEEHYYPLTTESCSIQHGNVMSTGGSKIIDIIHDKAHSRSPIQDKS